MSGISNIAQTVPGLAVYRAGGYVQPAIRGVTTTVVGTGAEANVAIYVDGFYMPNQTGNVFDFANIAQVEVLKGPQGTLFGRNATGGALTIRTLEPSRDTSVRATATYGSFDDRRVSAYATTGLTNTLTADISFYSRRSDGWTRDVVRNVDATPLKAFQVRTKLQWTPTDNTKITAAYEHLFNSDATGLAYIYYPNGIWRKYAPTLPTASEPNTVSMNFNPLATARIDGAYLTAEQRFGAVTFKSLTMYRLETDRVLADLDGSTLAIFHQDNTSLERTVTQEFDLSGKIGRFDWIVGGFYYNDHFLDPNVVQVTGANNAAGVFTTTSVTNRRGVNSESFAGFVDGTYGITDHLFLTAGARYTTEYKAMEASRIAGAPRPAVAADHRWNSFTPRAAIRWEVAPRTDLYASYSRGFKSGNFNAAGFDPVPVNPEEISAYEVGVHTATRRTRFNASGFYYNYSNVQFSVFDFGQSVVRLINAAGATVYGADAEVTTSPTENLDLRASAAWTHARYDSFPGYPAFVPIGNNTGNNRVIVDLAGYRVFPSPDWKANVGATWRIPSPIGEVQPVKRRELPERNAACRIANRSGRLCAGQCPGELEEP